MKDSLDRRLRFTKPQPAGETIQLSGADITLFEALNRHGPLPTHYLFEFTRHERRNETNAKHRLTKLFHGTPNVPPYLSRPSQQFASFEARYQELIYDLTDTSRAVLVERGIPIVARGDPFLHRFMSACVSASIELGCKKRGLRYIPQEEILARRSSTLALPLLSGKLVPDGLFGIKYSDAGFLFFAVEIDRKTESIERSNLDQNAYGRKLVNYLEAFDSRTFNSHWGVPNLIVLTVTTNATHLKNMLAHLETLADLKQAKRFIFKAKPDFGVNWKVPPVMEDLLTEPWTRPGTEPFDMSKV